MILLFLFACAEFQGTDYRKGWREVECRVVNPEGGPAYMTADVELDEPRPVVFYVENDGESGHTFGPLWPGIIDGELRAYGDENPIGCRGWIAE